MEPLGVILTGSTPFISPTYADPADHKVSVFVTVPVTWTAFIAVLHQFDFMENMSDFSGVLTNIPTSTHLANLIIDTNMIHVKVLFLGLRHSSLHLSQGACYGVPKSPL